MAARSEASAAVVGHPFLPREGFERPDQDTARLSFGLARDVHAEVAAVDRVDVGMAGVAEQNQVAGSRTPMGVGGGEAHVHEGGR